MTERTGTKYKLWCTTDLKWVETDYKLDGDTPTVCSENDGHTIDSNSVVAIDHIKEAAVTIIEETTSTGGNFQVSTPAFIDGSKYISVPATVGTHNFDAKDDIPKGVLSIHFVTEETHKGDELEVHVSPDTLVAGLSAAVLAPISITSAAAQGTTGGATFTQIVATGHNYSAGDCVYISGNDEIPDGDYTVSNPITDEFEIEVAFGTASVTHGTVASKTFYVSDTTYLKMGRYIKLAEGANVDDVARINTVGSNYVITSTPATQAFSAGTTGVLVTVKMMQNFMIGPPWMYTFGEDKIGTSYLPANTTVRVVYKNNDGVAKDFYVYAEYMY